MDLTPIPVPTAADAGIERRVQMKNHGNVLAVMVIYRHRGEEFRAAAQLAQEGGRGFTPSQALKAREDCTAAALQAVRVQVEAHNRAILPAPQLAAPDVPPCHYAPTLLRSRSPLPTSPSPTTGSSLPRLVRASTVSG